MKTTKRVGIASGFLLIVTGFAAGTLLSAAVQKSDIDSRSYNLGIIAGFSEIVGAGVKKLALSSPLTPPEMNALLAEAEKIAQGYGVKVFVEKDFLVTDLFAEEATSGKQVLFIYLDPVREEYLALKAEKEQLVKSGRYVGEARKNIARKFGRLLSYPDSHIDQMLSK